MVHGVACTQAVRHWLFAITQVRAHVLHQCRAAQVRHRQHAVNLGTSSHKSVVAHGALEHRVWVSGCSNLGTPRRKELAGRAGVRVEGEAIAANGVYATRLMLVGECGHPGCFRNRWHLQEWNFLNEPLRWRRRRCHTIGHVFIAVTCGTAHCHNTRPPASPARSGALRPWLAAMPSSARGEQRSSRGALRP